MTRDGWQLLAGAGCALALASAPFGEAAQGLVLLISMCCVPAAMIVGIARHRPQPRAPWLLLVGAVALLAVATSLRVLGVGAAGSPSPADVVAMVAYLVVIASTARFGRLRSHASDPTNMFDALVFTLASGIVLWATFMLPYLEDADLLTGDRVTGIVFAVLDCCIFFTVARLAIGPGARSTSYWLLATATALILASDVAIDVRIASMRVLGEGVLSLLLPTVSVLCCGAAALHPTMASIAKPAKVDVATVTRSRLSSMAGAVLLPPMLLAVRVLQTGDDRYVTWLGPVWLVITALVMARFGGLVRAHERVANVERVLARADAALASATGTDAMHAAVASGVAELLATCDDHSGAVAVVPFRDGRWEVRDGGVGPIDVDALRPMLEPLAASPRLGALTSVVEAAGGACWATILPMVAQRHLRGAVVAVHPAPLEAAVVAGAESMAADASLALEAASLTEDLHRQRSDRRFRALVENSSELIIVLVDGEVTFLSPSAERLLGQGCADVTALLARLHEADRPAVLSLLEGRRDRRRRVLSVECRIPTDDGDVRWFEVAVRDLTDDPEVRGRVINAYEITHRKLLEEDLRHQVLHDDLTGIANRALFRDRLEHALARRRDGASAGPAVLFIDVDDFKTVNDSLGHGVGDELLKVLAFRLASSLRAEDTPARLGGDEFAVLLPDVASSDEATEVASRLLDVLRQPVAFGAREISVTASVGVASAGPGSTAEVVLRNADIAMYCAKGAGKGRVQLFDEAMYRGAVERLELKGDLVHAIAREELQLHYQPLVELSTGRLAGFEALLRWRHAERGFVSPMAFVPIAEETGLIVPIGAWVLRESLRQLRQWNDRSGAPVKMSVNVSPHQLASDAIVGVVRDAIASSGVDASWVTLELTETAVLEDEAVRRRVVQLRELGVGIAADDFGTGFASYAVLQQLPFTVVKIDRSLIMGIPDDGGVAEAQVRSIVDMAHATGMEVVVEGIEDEVQRDVVAAMGCDRGQGYLFARPLPADEAAEWVRRTVLEGQARPRP